MRRRSKQRHEAAEQLNITAFMNLMVILVPFLLITAVFSRLAILELNIPLDQPAAADQQETLQLDVTIRGNSLEVSDRKGGLIKRIENNPAGYNFNALSETLKQIKTRFPDVLDSTLLSEPEIPYESLVQLMDTMRAAQILRGGDVIQAELFPNIAIGDAPLLSGAKE